VQGVGHIATGILTEKAGEYERASSQQITLFDAKVGRVWARVNAGASEGEVREAVEELYTYTTDTAIDVGDLRRQYREDGSSYFVGSGPWSVRERRVGALRAVLDHELIAEPGDVLAREKEDGGVQDVLVAGVEVGEYGVTYRLVRPYTSGGEARVETFGDVQSWGKPPAATVIGQIYKPKGGPLSENSRRILAQHIQAET